MWFSNIKAAKRFLNSALVEVRFLGVANQVIKVTSRTSHDLWEQLGKGQASLRMGSTVHT